MRQDRWEAAARAEDWLVEAPELVIEVSSPSKRKLYKKAALYLEHGAEQVWVVYPKSRTVAVHTAESTVEARNGEFLEFHEVRIAVDEIFQL